MGVDYTANFGIGVKLINLDAEELEKLGFEYMGEYLEELPEANSIEVQYFEVGEGSYTGEDNEFYLCIKNALTDGVEQLANKIKVFTDYLETNNITYEGDVDVVGGLNVW